MDSTAQPLQISLWRFCRHSLFREYGWRFFLRLALPRPIKTIRAMRAAAALDVAGDEVVLPAGDFAPGEDGAHAIVGVGFCLKPLNPPCPSGRFNHDCLCLEHPAGADGRAVPAPCRDCVIRELGLLALRAGVAFYIMTSARDILCDLYVPARTRRTFAAGLFVLCRYSLRPFAAGLLVAGIRGRMWPFDRGDCRDYPTWLRADRGEKNERTEISAANLRRIREVLLAAAPARPPGTRFEKRGQILFPLAAPAGTGTSGNGVP